MKIDQRFNYSLPRYIGAILLILLLFGCDDRTQKVLQTAGAEAAQAAIDEGKKLAATELQQAKETAEAGAANTLDELRQTAEAKLATELASVTTGDANPKVLAARLVLRTMNAMKSPWTQVTAPIQNDANHRSAQNYADVIDQFDVASTDFEGRYKAGGSNLSDTRCNIFVGDVMRAMGVALPTKGNLGKGQGSANAAYTDPMTATASMLNDYLNRRIKWVTSLNDPGIESDWEEIDPTNQADLTRLIDHVNAGKPALVSDSGHIAVVRPGQQFVTSWEDLIIAQAGAVNFLSGELRGHFFGTPQFFIHD